MELTHGPGIARDGVVSSFAKRKDQRNRPSRWFAWMRCIFHTLRAMYSTTALTAAGNFAASISVM